MRKSLRLIKLPKEIFWTDTGTYEALIDASNFVYNIEKQTNKKIAIIEEIALRKGFIDKNKLFNIYDSMKKSQYGEYLKKIIDED